MVEEKEDRFTLFKQGDERIFRQYYEKYYHALCLWGGADYKRRDKNA